MQQNLKILSLGIYCPIFLLFIISNTYTMDIKNEIDLNIYETSKYSQFGEDGVIEAIFKLLGTTNKYYVEFGAGNGHYCSNVKYLREQYNWTGLLLDGACSNNMIDDLTINLHKEFITAENICDIFKKYNVPYEFDLISIDIDRNDFYVWQALSQNYKPRIVVIEFNSQFNYDDDKVIKYSPNEIWDGSVYFGASILAFFNLAKTLGYSLVYQESAGANLFFIRNDVLASNNIKFKNINDVSKIYKSSSVLTKIFMDPKTVNDRFTSSEQVLNKIRF